MERPAPCPRVNFALMERYIGQYVLLVCKVHIPPSLFCMMPKLGTHRPWSAGHLPVPPCICVRILTLLYT